MAARSKAWAYGRALAGVLGSNPAGGMGVCLLSVCVLSGRGLCDKLITRPEESYRVWCVSECAREASKKDVAYARFGLLRHRKGKSCYESLIHQRQGHIVQCPLSELYVT
jgi:hypothetical protein